MNKHILLIFGISLYVVLNIAIMLTVQLSTSTLKEQFNSNVPLQDRVYLFFENDQEFKVIINEETTFMDWSDIVFLKIQEKNIKISDFSSPNVKKENALLLLFPTYFIVKSEPIFCYEPH